MSIEQLLFLLVLVALPLLERLIRAMRTRTNSSAERARPVDGPVVSGSPLPGAPDDASGTAGRRMELTLPPSPIPPPLPQPIRRTVPQPLRPTAAALHARAPVIVAEDLRRAVVLIAILGPCRAFEPEDASGAFRR